MDKAVVFFSALPLIVAGPLVVAVILVVFSLVNYRFSRNQTPYQDYVVSVPPRSTARAWATTSMLALDSTVEDKVTIKSVLPKSNNVLPFRRRG